MDIYYTKHAIHRMFERNISEKEVSRAFEDRWIIAEYLDDKPHPSFLINSKVKEHPLHVVFSENDEKRIIITVYRPTHAEWNEDFARRK